MEGEQQRSTCTVYTDENKTEYWSEYASGYILLNRTLRFSSSVAEKYEHGEEFDA